MNIEADILRWRIAANERAIRELKKQPTALNYLKQQSKQADINECLNKLKLCGSI
jgi:hypothetical protein